jgi:hypothetical protein
MVNNNVSIYKNLTPKLTISGTLYGKEERIFTKVLNKVHFHVGYF